MTQQTTGIAASAPAPHTSGNANSVSTDGLAGGANSLPPQSLQVSSISYQGVLPPPQMLAQFDTTLPGSAERIMRMAEQDALHRRETERLQVQSEAELRHRQMDIVDEQSRIVQASDKRGQNYGLLICILCIALAAWLGYMGREVVAVALAAIPCAAIIRAFFVPKAK